MSERVRLRDSGRESDREKERVFLCVSDKKSENEIERSRETGAPVSIAAVLDDAIVVDRLQDPEVAPHHRRAQHVLDDLIGTKCIKLSQFVFLDDILTKENNCINAFLFLVWSNFVANFRWQ